MSDNFVLLLDIYGALLPKSQRTALDLKYNSDLSISEIAEEMGGISRQSVNDFLKKGKAKLSQLEKIFKSASRHSKLTNELNMALHLIEELQKDNSDIRILQLKDLIEKIKETANN